MILGKQLIEVDVTAEYLASASPGKGSLKEEDGFNKKTHSSELKIAHILIDIFGSDITLLAEDYSKENPDYVWRGKLWDLKSPNKPGNLGKLIKKGLSQIFSNPGGIVLDISGLTITELKVQGILRERLATSMKSSVDVIIIKNSRLVKVLRYKK